MEDIMLPGPQGKVPRTYEVDKERHTESYITAVRGNDHKVAKTITVDESKDDIQMRACAPLLEASKLGEKFGYTVAEMERYRNDPFWKTLRWLLFVLFWLVWILMFVVSILIVVLSPGCTLRAAPNWWENAIVYQNTFATHCFKIWTPSFQDSDANGFGDFIGLTNRLENLRRLGVQAVWLNPFLHSDDFSDAVRDHLMVDPKLGTNDDASKLIDAVHDKGMKIVVSLPVSVTSKEHDWYRQSSHANLKEYTKFSDYYHWREVAEDNPFMSKHENVSFYIHFQNRTNWPVLNWQSAFVQEDMFKIISYWIDKGIDGFYLSGIEYLARMKSGSVADWSRITDILRDIRNHVDTYVEKSSMAKTKQIVLFAARGNTREDDKKLVLSGLNLVIDYELGSTGKDNQIGRLTEGNVAECVHEIITELVQFHATDNISAVWEFGNPQLSRIASRVKSQQQAELLTMLQLLLPGTSSIYYGDEIGMVDLPTETLVPVQRGAMQWDDSVNAGFSSAISVRIPVHPDFADNNWARQYSSQHSQLKTFQKIARLRKRDETLSSGHIIIGQLMNSSFTITRYVKDEKTPTGNTYLGAFNFGKVDTVLSVQESNIMENMELHRVMVLAFSSNAEQYYYRQIIDLSSGTVTVPPEQGYIFMFSS